MPPTLQNSHNFMWVTANVHVDWGGCGGSILGHPPILHMLREMGTIIFIYLGKRRLFQLGCLGSGKK